MSSPRTRVLSVALAAAAWGVLFALPLDMAPGARVALALSVTAALFWTLEPVPVEFTSLCLLAVLPASRRHPMRPSRGRKPRLCSADARRSDFASSSA